MASVDYFLKIEGVDGESSDDKHKGEIELESWSFGSTNAGSFSSGGGGGSGKVAMQDFNFVKRVDKASPKLFASCCTGEHLKSATLVCRKAGGEQQEFLTIVLSPVLVSSFQTSGASGSEVIPMDQVSLDFGKIEVKYKEQKPDGSLGGEVIGGWDVTTNKKV
ncbi:Hcp family type VI secretion system effector [Azohydromonas aeria]|uniref:Hcp family type VI secretion system effector n=1 Tax=Azohydromonas aeria TaxID=2590212 RepID=UPI0012F77908|nr:type VI secretion system tube protein Hcp [Azohydromonas aeria]